MTALSAVTGPLAALLLVVGFGLLVRAGVQIYRTVGLGQPDGHRAGPVGARLRTLFTEFAGHTRMLKWGVVGVAHWFVMVGFGA